MEMRTAASIALLVLAFVYLISATRRKAEGFEFAGALFIGELGLMGVLADVIDPQPVALAVTLALGISLVVTAVVWARLFRRRNI